MDEWSQGECSKDEVMELRRSEGVELRLMLQG